MKMNNKLVVAIAAVAVVLMATSKMDTDSKKFGHLNRMEILSLMPGAKTAQQKLMDYQAELEKDLQSMIDDYQKKVKDYEDAQKKGTSEALLKIKVEEIQTMQERIQRTQQAFEDELIEKQQKLMQPLADSINTAINTVAKEKGLSYVFDSAPNLGVVLYADKADDITADVRAKLKIPANAKPVTMSGAGQ